MAASTPAADKGTDTDTDKPARVAIVGCGSRGATYARLALEHPEWMTVVAVAEPRAVLRARMQRDYSIADELAFETWEPLYEKLGPKSESDRAIDAVVIATQDRMHAAPAIAACEAGLHVLLEKPMAVDEAECRAIAAAAERSGVIFGVCHVLRYIPLYTRAREILHGGADGVDLGRIKMVDHVEPVGHWHFAHSYVRGNWANTAKSSCSFMAKSCHDIDLVANLVGTRAVSVVASSTPSEYADPANQPAEAMGATRCSECPIKDSCPVSAERVYYKRVAEEGLAGWPAKVVAPELGDIEDEGERARVIRKAIDEGPYGRCAWHCEEHDVADNQAALVTFDGGSMAVIKMTAHSQLLCDRFTTVYCTGGEMEIDMASNTLRYRVFGAGPTSRIPDWAEERMAVAPTTEMTTHGGGDYFTIESFARAVRTGDRSAVRTSAADALASHLLVFAIEKERLKTAGLATGIAASASSGAGAGSADA